MPESLAAVVLVTLAGLALWGAVDYIVESVRIFRRALKRHRARNED